MLHRNNGRGAWWLTCLGVWGGRGGGRERVVWCGRVCRPPECPVPSRRARLARTWQCYRHVAAWKQRPNLQSLCARGDRTSCYSAIHRPHDVRGFVAAIVAVAMCREWSCTPTAMLANTLFQGPKIPRGWRAIAATHGTSQRAKPRRGTKDGEGQYQRACGVQDSSQATAGGRRPK